MELNVRVPLELRSPCKRKLQGGEAEPSLDAEDHFERIGTRQTL